MISIDFLYFCNDKYRVIVMRYLLRLVSIICFLAFAWDAYHYIKEKTTKYEHRTVLCIPVYGQSYALGEEAIRITDFDSLRIKYDGRIVTEHMDYVFGYYDHSSRIKQYIKRLLHYDKKAFELSIYGMAESLVPHLGKDTILCIFPGGVGMAPIDKLSKPCRPYKKFMREITYAYHKAHERGWDFNVPAICWMQGESDIVNYPGTDYKQLFEKIIHDFNTDIKEITHQKNDIRIICYQTNVITKGEKYKKNNYSATETQAPEIQMEEVRDNPHIWASGPVYPYSFVNEALHIDAISQKRIGNLAAKSILWLLRNKNRFRGVIPINTTVEGNEIHILFNVPCPPLCFDTINVRKADFYGFSVIRKDNVDIITDATLNHDTIILKCMESPIGCRIRYAINGEYMKSGWRIGPRGNLRDSQGIYEIISISGTQYPQHNWCYMFDYLCMPE